MDDRVTCGSSIRRREGTKYTRFWIERSPVWWPSADQGLDRRRLFRRMRPPPYYLPPERAQSSCYQENVVDPSNNLMPVDQTESQSLFLMDGLRCEPFLQVESRVDNRDRPIYYIFAKKPGIPGGVNKPAIKEGEEWQFKQPRK